MTIVGLHDFVKVSISALLKSFLLIMCIDAQFWPASTLLHGHIALAIPSLPETDPQILEHWCYADEDHLRKSSQAMDSGLEC